MRDLWLGLAAALCLLAFGQGTAAAMEHRKKEVTIPEESRVCVDCHVKEKVAATAIEEWKYSTHAKEGVGCLDCHAAQEADQDGFDHYGKRIATVVTPNDCA